MPADGSLLLYARTYAYTYAYTVHYSDIIVSVVASQITSISIVYSTICSGADQRKRQSYKLLAFVRGIHWWVVNSPHKGPVTRKMFPFDDLIMDHQVCVLYIIGPAHEGLTYFIWTWEQIWKHIMLPLLPMVWIFIMQWLFYFEYMEQISSLKDGSKINYHKYTNIMYSLSRHWFVC